MGRSSIYFLTREQFRHVIRRGLGRALLHLKHHPQTVYEDEILYACMHFTGYDASVDGLPTAYLWTALNWSGCKERLRKPIFEALLNATEDRAWWQLLELTDQYARNGDEEALGVMRRRFESNPRDDLLRGVEHIVRRDGSNGLRFLAQSLGSWMLKGEIDIEGHFFLQENPSLCSAQRIESTLRPLADSDEAIEAFLKCIDVDARASERKEAPDDLLLASLSRQRQLRRALDGLSFDKALQKLLDSNAKPTLALLRLWSRSASEIDFLGAAEYFQQGNGDFAVDLGLSIFPIAAYPLDPQPLIDLALGSDAKRSHFAYLSLHQVRHEKVRELYEQLIASENPSRYVFGLLNHNFKPGDLRTIQQWLNDYAATYPDQPSSDDEMDMHTYGSDLYDVCRKQPASEGTGAVYLWLFDNMACKLCRCDALKALIDQGAADDEMLFEATFDADAGIRRNARRTLRGRTG